MNVGGGTSIANTPPGHTNPQATGVSRAQASSSVTGATVLVFFQPFGTESVLGSLSHGPPDSKTNGFNPYSFDCKHGSEYVAAVLA